MPGDPLLRARWEHRATQHLSEKRGVLLQNLPEYLNRAIDLWQAEVISATFMPQLPDNASVLDLAAGYGRLSRVLQALRPNTCLVGMDFSLTYCRLYAEQLGRAVCADLRRLPFAPGEWDGILLATGLMYLNPSERESTIQQVLCELKPGGIALFADPGQEIMALLRKLRPSLEQSSTGGGGFGIREYRRIFERPGYTIMASGGNVFFTCLLPVCLMLRRFPFFASAVAGFGVKLDLVSGGRGILALHRWVMVRREA